MSENCPKCGRPLVNGSCIACRLTSYMDSIRPKPEPAETPAPSKPSAQPVAPTKVQVSITLLDEAEHRASDDIFSMGSIEIVNTGDEESVVFVEAELNEEKLFVRKEAIGPGKSVKIQIESNSTSLCSEHDTRRNVRASVSDEHGNKIAFESKGIVFRPIFDFDLGDRRELAARWVTPNAKEIRDLLRQDGPIAEAMKAICGSYTVSGYQGKTPEEVLNSVLIQMGSVYDAFKDMGFSYCSDTFSYGNSDRLLYQRVKTPRKTLEDLSGNCIELSCLFASVYEAMGLHPVIVFPPGHAIVGVQITSDLIGDIPDFKVKNMIRFENVKVPGGAVENTDVLFLESTMVVSKDSTADAAIASAMETVTKNLDEIVGRSDFSLIFFRRHQGIKPIVEG